MFSSEINDISNLVEYIFIVGISKDSLKEISSQSDNIQCPINLYKLFPKEKEKELEEDTLKVIILFNLKVYVSQRINSI